MMCEFYLNLDRTRSLGLKGFWFSVFYRRRPLLIHPLPLPESDRHYHDDDHPTRIENVSLKDLLVLTLHGATTSYNTFPLSDAHVSIRFTDGTTFEELTDSDKSIPTEMFRFRNYDQLLALANTNRHLPHILGELTAIRSTINDGAHGSQRVMLTLRIESYALLSRSMVHHKTHSLSNHMLRNQSK
ncbi:hypothetical protein YC2023_114322 [Brassica napus]